MAKAKKVKVGIAPTRRVIFSVPEALRQKKMLEKKLRSWRVDFVNIDAVNEEGLLVERTDVPKVVDHFRAQGVEALFIPHMNFGTEDAAGRLARDLGVPTLLWGPRDDAPLPDGSRLRDTQCGLFATSKLLRRMGVPFSYIVNSTVDDIVFERGVKNFLGAAAAANAFRGARIGQVSTRPPAFWTVICNEGELLERWGVEVVPLALSDLLLAAQQKLADEARRVSAQVAAIKRRFEVGEVDADQLRKVAALKLAIAEWVERDGLGAVALQCWSALQDAFGIFPCFVHGLLTDEGTPVACETDIHGALAALMVQEAVGRTRAPFFADLTIRHPDDDNAELLWHCGPFPPSTAVPDKPKKLSGHYMAEGEPLGVGEWEAGGGPITLMRFDGDNGRYQMLIGHAEGTAGPFTRGTYLWAKVGNWPLWEERIIRGPYVHHVVGVHGHIGPVLYEACRFLGIDADCVEPTEAELQAWLRGE